MSPAVMVLEHCVSGSYGVGTLCLAAVYLGLQQLSVGTLRVLKFVIEQCVFS